ncbi:MOSC domain-containing protein YiiM [Saccharothrix ecbatanensis]|uniref:MOSC domain-containing protein YiiM n=1 Tax=Saccharothrix ecbatanensis TaxID=1105145 RepID=A0A7W9HJK3_9PSEU|nr:MOSC domain-containing protein [Saccharothrix ecbatanensis]MBB5803400.1 MOSC domain-containing protein YiiM [Saccharothrix ecbatanensis]
MLARTGSSGIDKQPVAGAVAVGIPAYGNSGLAGDFISDPEDHGGVDRAVYAYSREDLDLWQAELGRDLASGVFGENLTTVAVDVTGAEIGERWRIGSELVLEVSAPRTPCRTFAAWMDEKRWIHTFTQHALPGAYLRVLVPGSVRAGDTVEVVRRPGHGVTVGLVFRAITTESELLPQVAVVDALAGEMLATVRRRVGA